MLHYTETTALRMKVNVREEQERWEVGQHRTDSADTKISLGLQSFVEIVQEFMLVTM